MADVLRRPIDNQKDVWLFVGCLLAGTVGIFILKFLFGAPQGWVTAWPCLILAGYFLFVWRTKRYQLRGDRAGDSVYYLGFLYTLVSLGLSLFQFVFEGMGPREIVGNLGIALFTTILGLAGRVVLTQLREDPVEIEESARLALAQATSEVRGELAAMVEDVAIFRRTTVQQIVQATEELSKQTNKALEDNVTTFADVAKTVLERIESVFTEFGDNAKKLNKASTQTTNALEKLIARVEAIEAPQTLISAKFDPLADRIGEVFDNLEKRSEEQRGAVEKLRLALEGSAAKLSGSMESIGAIAATIKTAVDAVDTQAKDIAAQAESVRGLADHIKAALGETAEKHAASSEQMLKTTEQNLKTLIAAGSQTLGDLGASQKKISEDFTAVVRSLMEQVQTVVRSFEQSSKQIGDQSRQQSLDLLQGLNERLSRIGDEAKAANDESIGRLETITDKLADVAAREEKTLVLGEAEPQQAAIAG